ncbi:MAG: DNA recombination protein RmuC [Gammaproteobacteria bacterium]|nr:DNA recombination protein RmuC [Gammaproteobacteria bacterium]MDG2117939.1 DNA recombination protein RmuC [Gammaproteobacteria bacterium]|tara:strand:+ start:2304 stop:3605 length:1302 start_codon:yes stop_codon:yes gene_type:complete
MTFNLLLISVLLLNVTAIAVFLFFRKSANNSSAIENLIRNEFQRNRQEAQELARANREELSKSLANFEEKISSLSLSLNNVLREKFQDYSGQLTQANQQNSDKISSVEKVITTNLVSIREDNSKQLDKMRETVDEKLQKTINSRLSQSFETVGAQLKAVQEGLGEMKHLASDVGGLKKVLSNVKLRGGLGEVQLEMLLEQVLAPDQYEKNVKTKKGSNDPVEFAIKLPGKDDISSNVFLPIDAKFPKDMYEHLIDAHDIGNPKEIDLARKNLLSSVKKMAKDISEKYIDPPHTTDFGIMFLPFEGIYAEVVRDSVMLDDLQRNYKIVVAGPTTLAAILNSLQMGFRTLAIEKRSSEVWQVLGEVKQEFSKFGELMDKAKKNIETGLGQLDQGIGTRSRAIERKLKTVETLSVESQINNAAHLDEPASGLDPTD